MLHYPEARKARRKVGVNNFQLMIQEGVNFGECSANLVHSRQPPISKSQDIELIGGKSLFRIQEKRGKGRRQEVILLRLGLDRKGCFTFWLKQDSSGQALIPCQEPQGQRGLSWSSSSMEGWRHEEQMGYIRSGGPQLRVRHGREKNMRKATCSEVHQEPLCLDLVSRITQAL